jgi:hypothetical protein
MTASLSKYNFQPYVIVDKLRTSKWDCLRTFMNYKINLIYSLLGSLKLKYSQTCVQRPPLGPEKCGRYAEGCLKKISGK